MSDVDRITQNLWDGDQAITQGDYEKALELLEWVVLNPEHGGHQYMAAHAIIRCFSKYQDETGDLECFTPGTFHNQKMRLYLDLVIDLYPEMPPDIQRGLPIDNILALKNVFDNWEE